MAPLTSMPRSEGFWMSRALRALTFAFFVSVVLVSLAINLISFVWNKWVRHAFGGAEYEIHILIVVPAMLVLAGVIAWLLWDFAQVRGEQRARMPEEGTHMEPTTHAEADAQRRYDPNPTSAAKTVVTGPTGVRGYGQPSGGWDKPRLP